MLSVSLPSLCSHFHSSTDSVATVHGRRGRQIFIFVDVCSRFFPSLVLCSSERNNDVQVLRMKHASDTVWARCRTYNMLYTHDALTCLSLFLVAASSSCCCWLDSRHHTYIQQTSVLASIFQACVVFGVTPRRLLTAVLYHCAVSF